MSNSTLESITWKDYKIGDYFDIAIGKNIDGNKIDKASGKTPYVTRKEVLNGLDGFIDFGNKTYQNTASPVITIGNETAKPFVQTYAFYTGTKVNILNPKNNLDYRALLFIARCLESQKSKFSYSFTANSTRLSSQYILLPEGEDGEPNWAFMSKYIEDTESRIFDRALSHFKQRLNSLGKRHELGEPEWKEVYLEELFDFIQRGKRLIKTNQKSGKTPYISSTAVGNGVDNYIDNKIGIRRFEDGITIANSGSVGAVFYHSYPFIASDHVTVLRSADATVHSYLFIVTCLSKLGEKYAFNREMSDKRIRREKIMLPVDSLGNPDWDYMDTYMRNKEMDNILRFLKSAQPLTV